MDEHRALTLITAPGGEPLTLTEAKLHLRVDHSDEDALISMLIRAARRWCENYTSRALVTQTWELALDAFPCGEIKMPKAPLQSVESITYIDGFGVSQTLDLGDVQVDTRGVPARLLPAYGESWPATRSDLNAVVIRFVCGYANGSPVTDYGSNVPDELKQAMLLLIGHLYEHREMVSEQVNMTTVPKGAEWLAWPYRLAFL